MNFTLIDLMSVSIAFLVLAGYGVFLFILSSHRKKNAEINLKNRLADVSKTPAQRELQANSLIKESFSESEGYFKSKLPRVDGFTQWLQHTGLTIDPTVFFSISILLGIFIFVVFSFLFHLDIIFSMLGGAASSFIIPWAFISYLTSQQKNNFLADFPTALDMIQRALRSGHSSERALEMVSVQMKGPVGNAFRQIHEKMGLGEPPENVLADVANQLGIDEFRMLAIVLILQRETGGSLAESVDNFAKIIRARQSLKKKVKSLTGEVRATAGILTSIPFVILGLLYAASPQYLDPLFTTDTGHTLLMVGCTMLTIGIGVIAKMCRKDMY